MARAKAKLKAQAEAGLEMKLTPANLLQHELIGLEVEVERSTNKSMEGIRGRVVDETMKMLVIEDERRRLKNCLLYTSPSPRDRQKSRMPSSA